MEYLPEKKRTQKTQILKKETKIREFRQQLVDNNVVLAIVKCKCHLYVHMDCRWNHVLSYINVDLVAMRSQ